MNKSNLLVNSYKYSFTNSVFNKSESASPSLFKGPDVLSSVSKAKIPEISPENSSIDHSGNSLSDF